MFLSIHPQEARNYQPFGGPLGRNPLSARQSWDRPGNGGWGNGGDGNWKSDHDNPDKSKDKDGKKDNPGHNPAQWDEGSDDEEDQGENNGGGTGNQPGSIDGGSSGIAPGNNNGEDRSQGGSGGQQDPGSDTGGGGTNGGSSLQSQPLNSASSSVPPSPPSPESSPAYSAAPPNTPHLAANADGLISSDRPPRPTSTTSSNPSSPSLAPIPTNVADQRPQSHNAPTIVAVVITLLLFLAGISFFLYRYLRARRTRSTMRWWWSRRRATPSFHDNSPTVSRGSSPTSYLDSDDGASRSYSTLPSMTFATPHVNVSLPAGLSNPPGTSPPATIAAPSKALQFSSAVVPRWSDTRSMASSQTASSSRRTTGDHSKLHSHPFFSSDLSLPRPLPPPLPLQTHTTALSSSSFASTALSYTDPFSNHASPSTACVTSPEPLSSALPSSDWHTHSTDSVVSLPFSSTDSDESSTHDPRIIIVSSTHYDDSESVDYHTMLR